MFCYVLKIVTLSPAVLFEILCVMLWWDDNSWVAKSSATANENEPKRSSHRCRKEGKELLTLRMPQVGRNLQQEMPLIPLPTLKWGLGRGGSWLHPPLPNTQVHCTHLSFPGLTLPAHQVLTVSGRDLAFPLHFYMIVCFFSWCLPVRFWLDSWRLRDLKFVP